MTFDVRIKKNGRFDWNDDDMTARRLLNTLEDDRYRFFVRFLRFYFVDFGYDFFTDGYQNVCSPMFVYVSCCGAFTLPDKVRTVLFYLTVTN